MRSKFDEQLENLNKELVLMGALCEKAIATSARALLTGNVSLAGEVPSVSEEIDKKERDIESMCLKLLLRQQPVARDLRTVSAALKMITDMERIGVQSADIAEIITVTGIAAREDMLAIHDMAEATIKMVTESIDAFVGKDVSMAEDVIKYDDVVDNYFDKVKTILIELFSKPETDGEYALDLLMIAKYFERIGDHAVNIAEWVLFSLTGSRKVEGK
ncbi:MAG: phosphate signaling complex protein PhoU [Clostridia bacterium]|nr:phosphate signaling complex protein PhoU [Clostridia bacterium]